MAAEVQGGSVRTMATQIQLGFFDVPAPRAVRKIHPRFGGATYDAKKDGAALATQLEAVRDLMKDGRWRLPSEICRKLRPQLGYKPGEAAVTARLRDLRKPQFGSYQVKCRRRESSRAYEYAITGGGQERAA